MGIYENIQSNISMAEASLNQTDFEAEQFTRLKDLSNEELTRIVWLQSRQIKELDLKVKSLGDEMRRSNWKSG